MYNDDSTADHPHSRDGLSAEQLQKLKIAIPGYRVLSPIARGGQGDVYKAEQEGIGQVVAVKVMHGGFRDDERLDREAQILGALANEPTPNIVKIIDRGTMPDGRQFLVTRYIDGRPLNEYLSEPRLRADLAKDPSAPLRLFLKVCKVIGDQTHRYGVVHRDLSPSNILIDNSQEPHILDFGLAKTPFHPQISSSDQFLGKICYASPEQADNNPVDLRTDVYSLGVILYEILSGGRFPYPIKGSYRDVLNNIVSSPPIPLSDLEHHDGQHASKRMAALQALGPLPINPIIEAIVMKCLDKQQKNRYGSAAELGHDIANYLAGKPTIAQPPLTAPAPQTIRRERSAQSRPRPFLGRATFLTALGFVGAAFYLHNHAPPPVIEQKQNPAPPIEKKTDASPLEEQNSTPLIEKESPTKVSTPPDEQRILGKWKKNQSFMGMNTLFIEFCADGTMRDGTTARTLQGKYRLLPDNRIEMDQEGLLGKWSGRTKTVARYELTDNELLIMPLHGNDRYIRCERAK